MKLLVITQKVDKNDPVLGFFHKWIEELALKFEGVIVICLEKGEFNLPSNVRVFSLGKEKSKNKFLYVLKFFNLLVFQSLNYGSVFVHMNQEYILLGGILWKILGKKIFFWRNHPCGSFLTRIAVWFSDKVFYTSTGSYTAQFKKSIKMPVGIDIERWKDLKMERLKNSLLFLGRVAPIKNVHVLIEAAKILDEKDIDFVLDVVGEPLEKDQKYFDNLKREAGVLESKGKINFLKSVSNYETPEIYNSHQIFVNLTEAGSLDKTIFEAVVCGCLPLVANSSLAGEVPENLIIKSEAEEVAVKLELLLKMPSEEKEKIVSKLRENVEVRHSLERLMNLLEKEIKNE